MTRPRGPGHGPARRDGEPAAVAVFTALADPVRRTLLDSLAREGPATVTDLAARLPITRQAVAKHLTLLVDAGLIHPEEPEGRRIRYRVDPAPIREALRWLTLLANDWDARMDGLARYLGGGPGSVEGGD